MRYNKSHLSKRFSKESGLPLYKAEEITNAFLYSFRAFLIDMKVGDSLEIRDFAMFYMRHQKGRMINMPSESEKTAASPARRAIKFKTSKSIKTELKKLI